MKRLSQIFALVLLMLATLSLSDTGLLLAQGKSKKNKHDKNDHSCCHKDEYASTKGGPPDWAPAHGYRRKHECDDKEHKGKDKYDKHDKREEALKRKEEELKRREEALKRREKVEDDDRDIDKKDRRNGELKKRRTEPTTPEKVGGIFKRRTSDAEEKAKEKVIRKKDQEHTRQEEILKRPPVKQEGDWTGGSGW